MAPGIPIPESTMEFRRLGDSGLEVSVLCLGTMMFGDRTDASGAQQLVIKGGDHGFSDFADYLDEVMEFCVAPAG